MNPFVVVSAAQPDRPDDGPTELAGAVVAGSVSAEGVFHEHWINMYRLATVLVGDARVGEEIAQEAFTRWYGLRESVDRPGAYLRTLVVNLATGHHRRNNSARRWSHLFASSPVSSQGASPDVLSDMIHKLPVRQRAVIVLRFYEGCSEAEIAAILKCRPGTVKSSMSRALATLRTGLEQ